MTITRPPAIRWVDGPPGGADSDAVVWVSGPGASYPTLPMPNAADERAAGARPVQDRKAFLVRRALLRLLAASSLDIASEEVSVVTDRNGAPCLAGLREPRFLSSAHRGGWVASAVSPSPVGVDLEVVGQAAEPAWNILAPGEREWLAGHRTSDRWPAFLRLWTAKEAYVKAIGTGLAREPADIAVTLGGPDGFSIRDRGSAVEVVAAQHRLLAGGGQMVVAACVVLPLSGRSA